MQLVDAARVVVGPRRSLSLDVAQNERQLPRACTSAVAYSATSSSNAVGDGACPT
jgi:hypothetical protein